MEDSEFLQYLPTSEYAGIRVVIIINGEGV